MLQNIAQMFLWINYSGNHIQSW